jgi:hypothetical protein
MLENIFGAKKGKNDRVDKERSVGRGDLTTQEME